MPGMRMSRRMQPASRSGATFRISLPLSYDRTWKPLVLSAKPTERRTASSSSTMMDETRFLTAHYFASPLGTVKWKAVPPALRGSNQMRPPCASMIVRQMERPIPIPFCFDVMKGWKS